MDEQAAGGIAAGGACTGEDARAEEHAYAREDACVEMVACVEMDAGPQEEGSCTQEGAGAGPDDGSTDRPAKRRLTQDRVEAYAAAAAVAADPRVKPPPAAAEAALPAELPNGEHDQVDEEMEQNADEVIEVEVVVEDDYAEAPWDPDCVWK